MMKAFFFVLFLFSISVSVHAGEKEICSTVVFRNSPPFKFTADEIRLLCGSKENDSASQAWGTIPPWQAQMFLKAMLQKRGFHNSAYETHNDKLYVELGPPTLITHITLQGAPLELDTNRKRNIVRKELTPAKLDELQNWIIFELRHLGYPCPKADVTADYISGEVLVVVQAGTILKIVKVDSDLIGDLHPGVVRRYDAFHIDDQYDIWNVLLTESRIVDDNLVLGNHISTKCTPSGAVLYQNIEAGLPRLLQIGVGIDTELGPQFKVATHYSRMNQRGSSLDNTLTASFRIQDVKSQFKWYVLKTPSSFYIKPSVEVKRDSESNYTYVETAASFLPSASWDDHKHHYEASVGPSFQKDFLVSGIGPAESQYVLLNESLFLITHNFEYFKSEPQSGFKFGLSSLQGNKGLGSSITLNQLTISAEALFNLGHFSPPALVFGIRGLLGTLITPNFGSDLSNLPPGFKYYLGGTQDLRGFGRQELPVNSGLGAMTKAYLGSELRELALLPFNLQPFIFADIGALGSAPETLEQPVYWSPGFGLRWASPVGAFRVEAAHGYLLNAPLASDPALSHWQFYLSYGVEF
jgi:translocation and assembly module TamA